LGVAAGVGAVVVVVVQVGVLAAQSGVAGVVVAGEGWSPALVEDGLVERFDVAVGLGATGVDAGVAGAEPVEGGGESALEFVAGTRGTEAGRCLPWKASRHRYQEATAGAGA
jgi:hypothetical protein